MHIPVSREQRSSLLWRGPLWAGTKELLSLQSGCTVREPIRHFMEADAQLMVQRGVRCKSKARRFIPQRSGVLRSCRAPAFVLGHILQREFVWRWLNRIGPIQQIKSDYRWKCKPTGSCRMRLS